MVHEHFGLGRNVSKQTIIDWQRNGLLAAVGNQRGNSFTIDKLSYQPIGQGEKNATGQQALVVAAGELGHSKGPATVVVAREMVEVRTISVPRMDPGELPDVIRFQAQRQLANMGETWPIDYILLPDAPGQEMLTALVGVIAPNVLAEITSACESAGFQVAQVALRPLEIARYAVSSGNIPAKGLSMLISVSDQSADLMILKDGYVVQVRGTKLPSDRAQLMSSVKGEIRRSLMAASSHTGDSPLAAVMLLASPDVAADIQAAVLETADVPVTVVDPASLLSSSIATSTEALTAAGPRLAAVAGAVALPAAARTAVIDFKNPKKRPPKKSHRQTYLLAASAAGLLLMSGISWWYWTNSNLDTELADLKIAKKEHEEQQLVAIQKSKELGQIASFLESSPNWLDELTYISNRIPPSDKVHLIGPRFNTSNTGATINITTVAADSDTTLEEFENSLRDEFHDVTIASRKKLPAAIGNYRWTGSSVAINVRDRGWKLAEEISLRKPAPNDSAAKDSAPKDAAESDEKSPASTPNAAAEAQQAEAEQTDEQQPDAAEPEDDKPEDDKPEDDTANATPPEDSDDDADEKSVAADDAP